MLFSEQHVLIQVKTNNMMEKQWKKHAVHWTACFFGDKNKYKSIQDHPVQAFPGLKNQILVFFQKN